MDAGITDQLGAFYLAHRQELFTYALSITRSPVSAEDAVHEAFSRLLKRSRLPWSLRPYAFRCVRNAALDVRRYAQREQEKLAGYAILFHDAEQGTDRDAAAALELLSEKEREIVILKVYSGLTFREIAAVCGARQGTVASSYWRSLQKMRAGLRLEGSGI
jgi:RNA polymerase sigma-70 factor (ECF subfamily)